jgi:hypothetical protein
MLKPGARAAFLIGDGAQVNGLEVLRNAALSAGATPPRALYSHTTTGVPHCRPSGLFHEVGFASISLAFDGPMERPPGTRRKEHILLLERTDA